jgi:hypothetical protein
VLDLIFSFWVKNVRLIWGPKETLFGTMTCLRIQIGLTFGGRFDKILLPETFVSYPSKWIFSPKRMARVKNYICWVFSDWDIWVREKSKKCGLAGLSSPRLDFNIRLCKQTNSQTKVFFNVSQIEIFFSGVQQIDGGQWEPDVKPRSAESVYAAIFIFLSTVSCLTRATRFGEFSPTYWATIYFFVVFRKF